MTDIAWWKKGIVYQVYPLSFQDSNGDGKGDLAGIRSRLDYLSWLGVDAIWISPIFPSPMADFGYDVADYCNVAPEFGTLDEFDALVEDAHARGLRIILDFVPNHTSDQHPWFVESKQSRNSPKRDWYIWRDAAPGGGPPNNWVSNFGGPAWTYDETTGQVFHHAFLAAQPDLNWRNPAVRAAMYDVLRFWMSRGVDGFRVDVLWHLIKDEAFRDNPPNPGYQPGDPEIRKFLQVYSADQPEIFQVLTEMRRVVNEFDERVLIGEIYLPLERLVTYYGVAGSGVHLPFNFHLIQAPWNARDIAGIIAEYERLLPPDGWPNWVLGNHDQSRLGTRIGAEQERVAAMLLLTLRGTPTLYYGDEIGMVDLVFSPEEARDCWTKNEPGLGVGRDPERTPMQWDDSPNAGFSSARPWLPVHPGFPSTNVRRLSEDGRSLLTLYRRLIQLRRQSPALSVGAKHLVEGAEGDGDVLSYERREGDERLLVALNFRAEERRVSSHRGTLLLSTYLDREGETGSTFALRPHEGVVLRLA